ncbi:SAM-dependent methyltransferase [Burkholderia ubonensis]|uniref:class I SAM-dependent methyltransferase n=1 Tax=Burkholderia ubonensis TaxID=101571 RepID=UPI0007536E06|nr:class I SAM-dependent methyltransferase [Burkholderia ubonensis]KWK05965.1 SAM-dependent methyltransferase [Burkholderia ubonensis]KWK56460.1 SAM-dependent methyltransferase [Burkholderia ubonensis]
MRTNTPAEVNADTYDHYVDAFTLEWNRNLVQRVEQELAQRRIASGRLLDVGTGTARTLIELARVPSLAPLGFVGVDYYDDMVQRAEQNVRAEGLGERIEIRAGDVHALPFDDGTFVAVIGRSVVHHWADPIGAYREIFRMLAPGGFALVHEPCSDPDPAALAFFNERRAAANVHPVNLEGKFTVAESVEQLREAGIGEYAHVLKGSGMLAIGFEVLIAKPARQ